MSLEIDSDKQLSELRNAADAFRCAMIRSGAIHKVPQDAYIAELRALECALNSMNYVRKDQPTASVVTLPVIRIER